jgi:hypothetical protein
MAIDTGLLDLLLTLDRHGVQPVRHGRFLGLLGPGLDRLPGSVWGELKRCRSPLLRHLKNTPRPYQARHRRHRGK